MDFTLSVYNYDIKTYICMQDLCLCQILIQYPSELDVKGPAVGTKWLKNLNDHEYCTSTKFYYVLNFTIFTDPEDVLNLICVKHNKIDINLQALVPLV